MRHLRETARRIALLAIVAAAVRAQDERLREAIGVHGVGAAGAAAQQGARRHRSEFAPTQISDLWGWWDGDLVTLDGSSRVSAWPDQSGNARDMTQGTASNRPHYIANDATLGKGAVDFQPASSDQLDMPSLSALTEGEMFFRLRAKADPGASAGSSGFGRIGTSSTAAHYPYTDGNIYDGTLTNDRPTVGNPATDLTTDHVYNVISTSTEWTALVNRTEMFTRASNTVAGNGGPVLGVSAGGINANIVVAEVVLYTRKLTTAERDDVLTFLGQP